MMDLVMLAREYYNMFEYYIIHVFGNLTFQSLFSIDRSSLYQNDLSFVGTSHWLAGCGAIH